MFGSVLSGLISPVLGFLSGLFQTVLFLVLGLSFIGTAYFFIRYLVNPFKLNLAQLRALKIKNKYYDLLRWLIVDFSEQKKYRGEFREYGFTFYVGRQGAGKTASMVNYLDRMRARFPGCVIVTNFQYAYADHIMVDWQDILHVRNGVDGVIFAIDEIQSEYSSSAWKDVPESLLSEISQQRKQRIKIVATAQFFTRIAKPLREQAHSVVLCSTWAGRFTRMREYDALQYATMLDNPLTISKKLKPLRKFSFVQSDDFRKEYDTYEKINRMKKMKFLPRSERGDS